MVFHRYVYGMSTVRPTSHPNSLMKVDTVAGSTTIWQEAGCCAGVFILLEMIEYKDWKMLTVRSLCTIVGLADALIDEQRR